jgi:peroxiredoxin
MSPTIQEQADQIRAASTGRLPAEVIDAFARDRERMIGRGTSPEAVAAGDLLQDFILPDTTGQDVSLSKLVASGPAVLVFYRGGWCPYCNIALRAYQAQLVPALAEKGIPVVAISPQTPDGSLSTQETKELTFTVLSDPGNQIAGELGILTAPSDDARAAQLQLGLDLTKVNVDATTTLPMPAVVIVDEAGVIRWLDVHADYTTRTEPREVLQAIARTIG